MFINQNLVFYKIMNRTYQAIAYVLLSLPLLHGCAVTQARPEQNHTTIQEKIKKFKSLFPKKRELQKENGTCILDRISSGNKEYNISIFVPNSFEKDQQETLSITKFTKQNPNAFEQIQLNDHKLDGLDAAKTVKITLEDTLFTTRVYEETTKQYDASTNIGAENKHFYEGAYGSILDEITAIYED